MRAREDSASGAGGVGDAATRLAQDTAELARREVRALQDEAMTTLRRFAAGGTLLAGAGVCGILAVWSAHETVLRAAESFLPRARASTLLTCTYATSAALLSLAARNRIRAAARAAASVVEQEREKMPSVPTDPEGRTADS